MTFAVKSAVKNNNYLKSPTCWWEKDRHLEGGEWGVWGNLKSHCVRLWFNVISRPHCGAQLFTGISVSTSSLPFHAFQSNPDKNTKLILNSCCMKLFWSLFILSVWCCWFRLVVFHCIICKNGNWWRRLNLRPLCSACITLDAASWPRDDSGLNTLLTYRADKRLRGRLHTCPAVKLLSHFNFKSNAQVWKVYFLSGWHQCVCSG